LLNTNLLNSLISKKLNYPFDIKRRFKNMLRIKAIRYLVLISELYILRIGPIFPYNNLTIRYLIPEFNKRNIMPVEVDIPIDFCPYWSVKEEIQPKIKIALIIIDFKIDLLLNHFCIL